MTNYEKIHSMTATELAAFLEAMEDNGAPWNDPSNVCRGCKAGTCDGCNLVSRWLNGEVTE